MKKRLTPRQSKLLKRIEKTARTAALLRLRGNIAQAQRHDHNLDLLFQSADDARLSGAGLEREDRGRTRGRAIHMKVGNQRYKGPK